MKRKTKKMAIIGMAAVLALALVLVCWLAMQEKHPAFSTLKATVLKVGKADAIVLCTENCTTVIDAGEEEDGEEIAWYLQEEGIRRIDQLIITHYDKDHVGGADTLIEMVPVDRVIIADYVGSSTEYQDFMNALDAAGIVPERLQEPVSFTMDDASVLVEPPVSYEIPEGQLEYDNNLSLITTVTHGTNRMLFTGDMEKAEIRSWLENGQVKHCQFMKFPHHGVYNTANRELLQAVQPEDVVICVSNKNPSDDKTLEELAELGIRAWETKDGNISAISDGRKIEVRQEQ